MQIPEPIPWTADPFHVPGQWPADRPLIVLWSGRFHERWARWTILAQPEGWVIGHADHASIEGVLPPGLDGVTNLKAPASLAATIRAGIARDRCSHPRGAPPFLGGWIGQLDYELGALLEPAAKSPDARRAREESPVYSLGWCPAALAYDHALGRWWSIGDTSELRSLIASPASAESRPATAWTHIDFASGQHEYEQRVAQAIDLIGAGDIFQANITRALRSHFSGSVRHLSIAAREVSQAWYGAHVELPAGRCIVSMSPELFLEVNGDTRQVITRPIKGSRSALRTDNSDTHDALLRSSKDAAELNMIIDLMRNDLGRVCEIGSIEVPSGRIIEQHPTILHGVGEVHGRLRASADVVDLIKASFPAGSITGAPKIRAMQIIESLEAARRGAYCGSVGYFSACGNAGLNVAIRTLELTGNRPARRFDLLRDAAATYGVGSGIVAESDPTSEFQETIDKAAVLRSLQGAVCGQISSPLVSVEGVAAQRCSGISAQQQMADAPD